MRGRYGTFHETNTKRSRTFSISSTESLKNPSTQPHSIISIFLSLLSQLRHSSIRFRFRSTELMAFPLVLHESRRISWGIYEPLEDCDIDDAIAHITKLIASLERAGCVKSAILRSINGSLAAVFAVWNGRSNADQSSTDNPATAEFAKELARVVRVVESGWMQMSSHEHTHISFAKLCVGNVVSLRRIYSSREKQDVFAYSCLAVLKAYFAHIEGILSATFYKSMDGKRIIGLGVWDGIESASALLDKSKGSPGEVYWTGLEAKKLKYDVCHVVHVTEDLDRMAFLF